MFFTHQFSALRVKYRTQWGETLASLVDPVIHVDTSTKQACNFSRDSLAFETYKENLNLSIIGIKIWI